MRNLAAVIVTLGLIATGCAKDSLRSPSTLPAAADGTTISRPSITAGDPTTTTAAPVPPAPIVEPQPGLWPAGLTRLVVANDDGVGLVFSDGTLQTLSDAPARVAESDGAGGLVIMPPVTPYKGIDADLVEWTAEWGPGQLMAVGPARELPFVDVVWVGSLYHGPRFAAVVAEEQRVPGVVRCLRLEPFAHVPLHVGVGTEVVCRSLADGTMTWASWSGRFFVLTMSTPAGTSWFEFVDSDGRPLTMLHNPAPAETARTGIRLGTAVGGTNRMVFVERDPAGFETLVGVDLADGREFLRMTIGELEVGADRIDAVRGAAVISRLRHGTERITPLLIDLATGAVGELEGAVAGTIPSDGPLEPVLYPEGTTRNGAAAIPDFVVTSPADHARVDTRVVRFEGWVTPGSTVVAGGYPAVVDQSGRWEIDLVLEPGSNVAGFEVTGPRPRTDAGYELPVYREVEDEPDRWERFYFWVPAPDYAEPFGEPIVDIWTRPGSPTGHRAYYQGPGVIAVVGVYGSPATPEMLWLVDQVGVGPAGHGRVYVTQDVVEVPDGIEVTYRLDSEDRVIVEFGTQAVLADRQAKQFLALPLTP